jgi:hypothetical protein
MTPQLADTDTDVVAAALADPTLTDRERANIALVQRFRSVPFAERGKHTVPGFKPSRIGMAGLAALLPPGSGPGYTGASIPDRIDRIVDILAHGDRVWLAWLIEGTHQGPLYGLPPTGKRISVLETGHFRIRDGLLAEAWFFVDEFALLSQLGRPDRLGRPLDIDQES